LYSRIYIVKEKDRVRYSRSEAPKPPYSQRTTVIHLNDAYELYNFNNLPEALEAVSFYWTTLLINEIDLTDQEDTIG